VRVLVAEDVQRLADDIAEGLRDQGIAANVAYDGADALFKLDLNPYDVLVWTGTCPASTATRSAARPPRPANRS
jgi:DNA-binding response OmpR family regulator